MDRALRLALELPEQDHKEIAACQSNLAAVLKDLGHLDEAEKLLRASLANFLESLGEGHPNTIIVQENLDFVLRLRDGG